MLTPSGLADFMGCHPVTGRDLVLYVRSLGGVQLDTGPSRTAFMLEGRLLLLPAVAEDRALLHYQRAAVQAFLRFDPSPGHATGFNCDDGLFVGHLGRTADTVVWHGASHALLEAARPGVVQAWQSLNPQPARARPPWSRTPAAALRRTPVFFGLFAIVVGALAALHCVASYRPHALPAADKLMGADRLSILQSVLHLLLWGLWAVRARGGGRPLSRRDVLLAAGVLGGIAALAIPANSMDIYYYIALGRLMAVFHVSPYLYVYPDLSTAADPFHELGKWWGYPLLYGPVSVMFCWLPGWVSQWSVLGAIYVIKAFWVALHVLGVRDLLDTLPPTSRWRHYVLLYALNPVVLVQFLINGHNDIVFVTGMIFSLNRVLRQDPRGAWGWAWLSALAKSQGLILIAALLFHGGWRNRRSSWGWAVVWALGLGLLGRLLVFHSFLDFQIILPSVQFMHSDFNLLGYMEDHDQYWPAWLTHALHLASGLACVGVLLRAPTFRRLVLGQVVVISVVLNVVTPYYQPWYGTWIMPLAVLVPDLLPYFLVLGLTGLMGPYFHGLSLPLSALVVGALLWGDRGRNPVETGVSVILTVLLAFSLTLPQDERNGLMLANHLICQVVPMLWLVSRAPRFFASRGLPRASLDPPAAP